MWKNISTAPDTKMVLVYGKNPYGEEFYLYATKDKKSGEFYCENIESGLENGGVILQPEMWYDCPNAATYGEIFEGPPDPCAAIDCGSAEPYPTDVEGCASKDDGPECPETKKCDNGGGGGGGGGGSDNDWGKSCKNLDSSLNCKIGCFTQKGNVGVGGKCPFEKCKWQSCPCYEPGEVDRKCYQSGGSGMWSGHECGWAYKLWTICQIGCDTGPVGGVIKPDDPCPYGKCDKNRCPCFIVGPISPYCQ